MYIERSLLEIIDPVLTSGRSYMVTTQKEVVTCKIRSFFFLISGRILKKVANFSRVECHKLVDNIIVDDSNIKLHQKLMILPKVQALIKIALKSSPEPLNQFQQKSKISL